MQAEEARTEVRLSETVRRRLRARAAEELLSHDQIAKMITEAGHPTSRRKVSNVIAGQVRPQLDELAYWAEALRTSEAYLLGFTWDPRPEGSTPAAIVASHTPGALKLTPRRLTLVPNTGSALPQPVRHLVAVPES